MFSTCWDRLWMWINSSLVICEFSLWRNIWPFILWNEGFLGSQLVKNPPTMQETQFDSWARKFPWKRDRLPTPVFLGFPGGSDGKESACNVGDLGSIPGLGRYPGEGNGNPLQYSCLENPIDVYLQWGHKELDTIEHSLSFLSFFWQGSSGLVYGSLRRLQSDTGRLKSTKGWTGPYGSASKMTHSYG